jgi:hypothetical protein
MELHEITIRILDDDGMASYGLHPTVHQELVRCHNPALYQPEIDGPQPLVATRSRINRLMREPFAAVDGVTLSA